MEDQALLWTKIAAIGQVSGAIATFSAVAVSLWIVLTERRPNIKLFPSLSKILGAGDAAIDVISFEITNLGQQSVYVNSIGWRSGWLRWGPNFLKHEIAYQIPSGLPYSRDPPFELAPGQKANVLVSVQTFQHASATASEASFFTRRLPYMNKSISANIRATVTIASGKTVTVKVEKDLADFLTTGEMHSRAALSKTKTTNPSPQA